MKQIQLMARAGLEPGTKGLQVRRVDHSSRLPAVTVDITPSVRSIQAIRYSRLMRTVRVFKSIIWFYQLS